MLKNNLIYIIFTIIIFISDLTNYNSFFNRNEYYFYITFVLFTFLQILKNKLLIPYKYLLYLLTYCLLCVINYIISPYSSSVIYFSIGFVCSVLPFIHFIISYNYKLDNEYIIRFLNIIVSAVAIIDSISFLETFVFHSVTLGKSFIDTNLFWFQYLASINNQAIVLSIVLLKLTKKKKYKYLILLFAVFVILTLQLKTYVGLFLIFLCYSTIYGKKNIVIRLFSIIPVILLLFVALMQIDLISTKVSRYADLYFINTDGIARNELYNASIQIAIDKFPFGTGQGTFGSVPVNMYDSRVYYDYNINNVWGLSNDHEVNYKMDTHWSSIIGENGVLGTIIYLLLLLYPLYFISKYKKQYKDYYFLILCCLSVLVIESLVLNLISRLVFIMIYSGLTGVIVRYIYENNKKKLSYESTTSYNQLSD